MAKKVGKGIFIRSEPWQCYHAERNGYIFFISDKKNFTAALSGVSDTPKTKMRSTASGVKNTKIGKIKRAISIETAL